MIKCRVLKLKGILCQTRYDKIEEDRQGFLH